MSRLVDLSPTVAHGFKGPPSTDLGVQLAIGGPVIALSLLIRVLELFVAFLQAYIFTFLATLFIASAVAPEH